MNMARFTDAGFAPLQIAPALTIRSATAVEKSLARPLSVLTGLNDFDVVEYCDGRKKHAPEVINVLSEILATTPQPSLLIFAHRGQQIECMMPLLPSLLYAIGYRGTAQALRVHANEDHGEADARIKRFAAMQLAENETAILVNDHQERIGAPGTLLAQTVDISFLMKQSLAPLTAACV